jgi:hypothetical protein
MSELLILFAGRSATSLPPIRNEANREQYVRRVLYVLSLRFFWIQSRNRSISSPAVSTVLPLLVVSSSARFLMWAAKSLFASS